MPNSGLDDLSIAQEACAQVGIDPIQSFTGTLAEQVVLEARFESVSRAAISRYRFSWGRIQQSILPSATGPLARWDTAFLLPADTIEPNAFYVNDDPVGYHRYNQYVYVDSDANQTNVLDYTYRPTTSSWPPLFVDALVWRLSAILVLGVKEDAAQARQINDEAHELFLLAQFADSSGQEAGGFDLESGKNVRRGGSRRRRKS